MRELYKDNGYRIVELQDGDFDIKDLKGDMFNPELHPELDAKKIRQEEREFESKIETEGTYGYILEKWNPEIDAGWEHIDSCWGFVGCHESENHYIVDEMKQRIRDL